MKTRLVTGPDQQATKVRAVSGRTPHLHCITSKRASLRHCRTLFDCQAERMTAPAGIARSARLPRPYREVDRSR
jgi:hypothetical protein